MGINTFHKWRSIVISALHRHATVGLNRALTKMNIPLTKPGLYNVSLKKNTLTYYDEGQKMVFDY